MDTVITTERLTKKYGDQLAVDQMHLTVGRGEIYAFLGLNGAGKSTTIRMILGMIHPTEGHVRVLGRRVGAGASDLWRRVGHLVDAASAYPDLTVRENLEIARRLHPGVGRARVDEVIDQLRIRPYADRRASHLSMGNLQRLALARALLHEPELLVLDEPASALDPAGVIEIRQLLRSIAARGATVFLSSHHLTEVERVADRVGIIHRGRLVEELDAPGLARIRREQLVVGGRDLPRMEAALAARGLSVARVTRRDGTEALTCASPAAVDAPDEVARWLVAADAPPTHLAVVREELEAHFVRLTSGGGS